MARHGRLSKPVSSRDGARRIRDYIVNAAAKGNLAPGARLPTERELAKRFAVPRNAVRSTLAQLEAEGSITRHVGRGTFPRRSAFQRRGAIPRRQRCAYEPCGAHGSEAAHRARARRADRHERDARGLRAHGDVHRQGRARGHARRVRAVGRGAAPGARRRRPTTVSSSACSTWSPRFASRRNGASSRTAS